MRVSIAQIAAALDVEPLGDASVMVSGVSEPGLAGPDDLALAMSPKYAEALAEGKARAAIVWAGADWQALGLKAAVPVGRPRLAMAGLTRAFDPGPGWARGIHPSAVIDETAVIGEDVSIGPFSVIGQNARIGDGSRLGPHVTVGAGSVLGEMSLVHPGVRIGPRVRIGARFIVHANAVIGADGLSFVTPEVSAVENARHSLGDTGGAAGQAWTRIHSLGGIEIGDDCEIGAGTAIDYGTIRATRIGNGVKIDNLVHIAHNVVIGDHTLMAAQVGVAGSTVIGRHCVLGGKVGIGDNLRVGDNVIAGGGSNILSNVPDGRVVQGYPAVKMEQFVDSYKALRRLPRLLDRLAGLTKPVPDSSRND